MAISKKYTVLLFKEEDGTYSVDVPALPGCMTQGDTREEALSMAKDAIELYLESLAADGLPMPEERLSETRVIEVKTP